MIKPQSKRKKVSIADANEDSLIMKTPEKRPGDISSFNPLETPRTQANSSMKSSANSMKQKSPNTMMNDLTSSLNNTSLNDAEHEKNKALAEAFKNNYKIGQK